MQKRKEQYCYRNIGKINNLRVHQKLFRILSALIIFSCPIEQEENV